MAHSVYAYETVINVAEISLCCDNAIQCYSHSSYPAAHLHPVTQLKINWKIF